MVAHGIHQYRFAGIVRRVGIGIARQQHMRFDKLAVFAADRIHQSSLAVTVAHIDIGVGINPEILQYSYHINARRPFRRIHQHCFAVVVACRNVRAFLYQFAHHVRTPFADQIHQRRPPETVLFIQRCQPAIHHLAQNLHIAAFNRIHQHRFAVPAHSTAKQHKTVRQQVKSLGVSLLNRINHRLLAVFVRQIDIRSVIADKPDDFRIAVFRRIGQSRPSLNISFVNIVAFFQKHLRHRHIAAACRIHQRRPPLVVRRGKTYPVVNQPCRRFRAAFFRRIHQHRLALIIRFAGFGALFCQQPCRRISSASRSIHQRRPPGIVFCRNIGALVKQIIDNFRIAALRRIHQQRLARIVDFKNIAAFFRHSGKIGIAPAARIQHQQRLAVISRLVDVFKPLFQQCNNLGMLRRVFNRRPDNRAPVGLRLPHVRPLLQQKTHAVDIAVFRRIHQHALVFCRQRIRIRAALRQRQISIRPPLGQHQLHRRHRRPRPVLQK